MMLPSLAYRNGAARRIVRYTHREQYLPTSSTFRSYLSDSTSVRIRTPPPVKLQRPFSNTRPSPCCQFRYLSAGPGNNTTNSNKNEADGDSNGAATSSPSIWTQIQSIPNMITMGRMASTPVLCYWIVHEHYALAISGCILAAISDGLDGYLAKHYDGSTVLGTYLDPIADKVLINGLAVSLWYSGILPTPLTLLWATKDVMLLSGTAWHLYQQNKTVNILSNSIMTKPLTVTPSLLGKINTGLQFATLWVGILTPVMSPATLPPVLLPSLCWVTGFTTVGSVLSYTGGAGIKLFSKDTATKNSDNDDNKETKK